MDVEEGFKFIRAAKAILQSQPPLSRDFRETLVELLGILEQALAEGLADEEVHTKMKMPHYLRSLEMWKDFRNKCKERSDAAES